jgi:hypothetical protein
MYVDQRSALLTVAAQNTRNCGLTSPAFAGEHCLAQ